MSAGARRVCLSSQSATVLFELRITPLKLPLISLHTTLDACVSACRSARAWACISRLSSHRAAHKEAVLWLLFEHKEAIARKDNAFLSFKRTIERRLHGTDVRKHQWTTVDGSAGVSVYADMHVLDESFEAVKLRLSAMAHADAADCIVSGPLEPVPAVIAA